MATTSQRFFIENSRMRLIIVPSYRALKRVRDEAMTPPFLRASTSTVHEPDIGTLPLPAYIWRFATHGSSNVFFISGMFIAGIAGMTRVTVTWASEMGLPLASLRLAWNVLFSSPFIG